MKINANVINAARESVEECEILGYLKVRDVQKFAIGDILIRKICNDNGEWAIQQEDGVPEKWVYVYEDELGNGAVAGIGTDGSISDYDISPMADMVGPEHLFEVDPEYANHLLLTGSGQDYNPQERAQEIKKQFAELDKYNKKHIIVHGGDIAGRNNFLSALKPKQVLNIAKRKYGNNLDNNDMRNFVIGARHEIVSVRRIKMTKDQFLTYYRGERWHKTLKRYYYTVKLKALDNNGARREQVKRVNSLTRDEFFVSLGQLKQYEQKI